MSFILASVLCPLNSVLCPKYSDFCPLSSVFYPQSSGLSVLPSVLLYLSSVLRPFTSLFCFCPLPPVSSCQSSSPSPLLSSPSSVCDCLADLPQPSHMADWGGQVNTALLLSTTLHWATLYSPGQLYTPLGYSALLCTVLHCSLRQACPAIGYSATLYTAQCSTASQICL